MAGPTVAELHVGGPAAPWRAAGFAIGADGRSRVGAVALRFGARGVGLAGWSLTGPGAGDVDGIPTEWVDPEADAPAGPVHPNTAVAVDQVVVRCSDPAATFAALQAAGMRLRRERTADAGARRVRQGFFRDGEATVEVVGPEPPEPRAPSVLWGLGVTVADLDACATLLGGRLGPARPAVQPGRRIATVAREAGLGVPLVLLSA